MQRRPQRRPSPGTAGSPRAQDRVNALWWLLGSSTGSAPSPRCRCLLSPLVTYRERSPLTRATEHPGCPLEPLQWLCCWCLGARARPREAPASLPALCALRELWKGLGSRGAWGASGRRRVQPAQDGPLGEQDVLVGRRRLAGAQGVLGVPSFPGSPSRGQSPSPQKLFLPAAPSRGREAAAQGPRGGDLGVLGRSLPLKQRAPNRPAWPVFCPGCCCWWEQVGKRFVK